MTTAVCLRGRIRSKQRCRSCHTGYKVVMSPATGDQIDLVCSCGGRPGLYYVDGRGIRDRRGVVGRLTRDPRDGGALNSFLRAKRLLDAIRMEIEQGLFDSRKWNGTAPAPPVVAIVRKGA